MHATLVAIACVLCAAAADGATSKPPYRLKLGGGWTALPAPAAKPARKLPTTIVEAHRHQRSGRELVITRTRFPNVGARHKLAAYANNLEVGLRRQPGYKRLRKRVQRLRHRIGRVDFTFRRTGPAGPQVVMMRFLLYRSSSYTLTLITPAKHWHHWRRRNRYLLRTFRPR